MTRAVVVEPWTAVYPAGIVLRRADPVTAVRTEPDSPGWIWCRGPSGGEAWVPEPEIQWLLGGGAGGQGLAGRRGRMRRDYDSTELTVAAGETLLILEEHSGWVRVERPAGGRGWIPRSCLGIRP
jgi:hypothetical protein